MVEGMGGSGPEAHKLDLHSRCCNSCKVLEYEVLLREDMVSTFS